MGSRPRNSTRAAKARSVNSSPKPRRKPAQSPEAAKRKSALREGIKSFLAANRLSRDAVHERPRPTKLRTGADMRCHFAPRETLRCIHAELAIFDRHAPAPTFAFRLSEQSVRSRAVTLQSGELSAQSRSAPAFSVLRYLVEHATRFVESLLVQQLGSQLEPQIAGVPKPFR